MKNLGNYKSLGEGWLAAVREIAENGIQREYTDNPAESFDVKECFNICLCVDEPKLPDPIIDEYKDETEYEWMLKNFKDFSTVEALHNANSYAERLYQYSGSKNQIEWVIERIHSNPQQRSCTITTFEPLTDEKYIPCVSLMDFQRSFEHEGKLDLNVYCRALDFGSKAYVNMVMIAMILEHVCDRTGLTAGKIGFIVKSAHFRTVDQSRIEGMLN